VQTGPLLCSCVCSRRAASAFGEVIRRGFTSTIVRLALGSPSSSRFIRAAVTDLWQHVAIICFKPDRGSLLFILAVKVSSPTVTVREHKRWKPSKCLLCSVATTNRVPSRSTENHEHVSSPHRSEKETQTLCLFV
jgi:hypothetical protein